MSNKDSIKMLKLLRAAKKAILFLEDEYNAKLILEYKFNNNIGLWRELKDAIEFTEIEND